MANKKRVSVNVTAILCAIIIAVAGVLVTLVGVGSSKNGKWFSNPSIKDWFNSWGKGNVIDDGGTETNANLIAIASDGTGLHSGCTYEMPTSIAVFRTADSSTYSPESEITVYANLTNPYIRGYYDYSVSFVNASSQWATGKNVEDYVTVTATEDGGQSAKIKFLQKFSEQIQVKAALRGSSKCGVCLIDCIKQNVFKNDLDFGIDISDFNEKNVINAGFQYGSGTVICSYYLRYCTVNIEDTFVTKFLSYLTFTPKINNSFTIQADGECNIDEGNGNIEFLSEIKYTDVFPDFDTYSDGQKQAIYYAWYHAAINDTSTFLMAFAADGYYNGQKTNVIVSTIEKGININGAAMGADSAPDVTFNTNIVF